MPDVKRSEGARLERKAMRAYLRRQLQSGMFSPAIEKALAWVLTRQKRYDKRKGGL